MSARTSRELAITTLHEEAAGALLAYFIKRVDVDSDSADLVSETFMIAWRKRHAAPSDVEELRMWTFGIARRVLWNYERGRRRRHALADALREQLHMEQQASSRQDHDDPLHAALARLKPVPRELVRLIHWDGFAVAEAAHIVGISPAAARGRYQRAKAQLRQELGYRRQAPQHQRAADEASALSP